MQKRKGQIFEALGNKRKIYGPGVAACAAWLLFCILTTRAFTAGAGTLDEANQLLAEGRYDKAYNAYLVHSESDPLAQFNLGLIELLGWGRTKNQKAACGWFEPAASAGVPMAQLYLGDCFRDGAHKPADFQRAKHWYLSAADSGLGQAYCLLGKIYLDGSLVEKDAQQGIKYCDRAARRGSAESALYLAERFEAGDEDVPRDLGRALSLYQTAATTNNAEAQYRLARFLYDQGADAEGQAAAIRYAEAAAARGYRPAYLLCAQLYVAAPVDAESGLPTAENLAKAYLWSQATLRDPVTAEAREAAQAILGRVRTVMPSEWESSLNIEVDDHFARLAR